MNKRKARFESSLKRCEALNVSDLRRKTVPRFKVKNLHIYLISFTVTSSHLQCAFNSEHFR